MEICKQSEEVDHWIISTYIKLWSSRNHSVTDISNRELYITFSPAKVINKIRNFDIISVNKCNEFLNSATILPGCYECI